MYVQRYKPNRIIAILILLMTGTLLYAQKEPTIDDLRKALPQKKGKERVELYGKIYRLSQSTDDFGLQWQSVTDYVREAHRQGLKVEECNARVERLLLFYNNDINDSVYYYGPGDLEFIKECKEWQRLYEAWGLYVNTYVFGGAVTTGLNEAEKMYTHASERKDEAGMGLAYYAMGNAYINMGLFDKASECSQKAIDLLMHQSKPSVQIGELFSLLSEVYERTGAYDKLDKMLPQWKEYIDRMISSYKIPEGDPGFMPIWAYYYIGCAQADLGLGRLDHAAEMLGEARTNIASEEDYSYRTWLFFRAKLCLQEGLYPEALTYNTQHIRLFNPANEPNDYVRGLMQQAEIMTRMGRHELAAKLYQQMYQLTDSVNGYEMKNQLAEMNTLLHVDEIKMQEERQRSRQMVLSIILIATIIVVALVIFIYFRHRSAKRLKVAHVALEDAHAELLTAYDQLEETTKAKERIESDLRIARDIQMSMVPATFPDRPDLDLYASMTPAKEVGGDLYGYLLQGDQLYFCLGDVSGKGVPASLFMAQATRLFRTLASQKMMPAEIATRLNDALSGEDNERGMFVTMFIGLADLTTGHLHFCNAGHNPPVLIGDGTTEFIEMIPNAPIGLWPELEYEGEEIADISNRPLFVYTDGLNEAENRQQEQFSDERLLEILQTTPFESSKQTIELLRTEVEKHRDGAEPNDDLTMLCVKIIKN